MAKTEETMGTIAKIFILHGWTTNSDKWKSFVNYLTDDRFSVELLRIPGLTDKIDRVWTLNDYAEWLKKILDKEKDKVILIGHSNGGRIALAYTSKYKEKIKRLVLIDAAGIRHNKPPITTKRLIFKTLAKIGKKFTSSVRLKNLLYKFARESDYKNSEPIMQKTMVNLISVNLKPILSKISVPTTIIWGENDKILPLADGKLMHKLIRKSKLYIIKDARHSPQYTHAEVVADEILGDITKTKL